MGAVYKARQPEIDRLVALKILPSDAAADPGFAERFTREARALARLNHPNIVAVYDFGHVNGLHYFIMEFVDGANLRQLEQAGRLSPARRCRSSRKSARPSSSRTTKASSTATSSRRTCCWTRRAA